MSFLDTIDRIRQKPEGVRRAYAFWISLVITGMLLMIWIPYIRRSLVVPDESVVFVGDSASSPLAQIRSAIDQAGLLFTQVRERVSGISASVARSEPAQ